MQYLVGMDWATFLKKAKKAKIKLLFDWRSLFHIDSLYHTRFPPIIKLTKSNGRIQFSQCGNFRIYLPFRIYVKSIFGIAKVLKTAILTFLWLWSLILLMFCDVSGLKLIKNKIQSLWNCKNGSFWTTLIFKFGFT